MENTYSIGRSCLFYVQIGILLLISYPGRLDRNSAKVVRSTSSTPVAEHLAWETVVRFPHSMNIQIRKCNVRRVLVLSVSAFLAGYPLLAGDDKPADKEKPSATAPERTEVPDGPQALGSLRGVTMTQGALSIAEASVVVRSMAGMERSLVSDAEGIFKLDGLEPGSYQITASKGDLRSAAAAVVEIEKDRTTNANVL